MIAVKTDECQKPCMSHLLLMDTFDSFLLIEGEIMTFNTFKNRRFYSKKLLYFWRTGTNGHTPWIRLLEAASGILLLPDQGKRLRLDFVCIQSVSEKYCPPYRAEWTRTWMPMTFRDSIWISAMIPPDFNALPVHLSNPSPWTSRWNTPGTTWYRSFSRKKDWISKFCNL